MAGWKSELHSELHPTVKGDLRRRLLVAAVGIPASIIVVYAGGPFIAFGLAFLAAVGFWEYASMMTAAGHRPFVGFGVIVALSLPLMVFSSGYRWVWVLYISSLCVGSVWAIQRLKPAERPITALAVTLFGAWYVGTLLSFGIPLREWFLSESAAEGTLLFFYPVVVTWLADTAAYTGGKTFGRRQLAPIVSPNKTIEGAVSALIAGSLGALLYGTLTPLPTVRALGVTRLLLFGLLVAVLAILGDLVESALKRECGQKDSSGLLPGHGGFLDRLDSLLWAIPGAYLFFTVAGL